MAKADKTISDIRKLLEQTDVALKKKKLPPKKVCKKEGCEKLATHHGFCKEDFFAGRKEREALKVGKEWRSTNGLWYTYNSMGQPQLLHRYVMEKKLGRKLERAERIIWKDGDKDNNDPANLILESDLLNRCCPHCGGSLV